MFKVASQILRNGHPVNINSNGLFRPFSLYSSQKHMFFVPLARIHSGATSNIRRSPPSSKPRKSSSSRSNLSNHTQKSTSFGSSRGEQPFESHQFDSPPRTSSGPSRSMNGTSPDYNESFNSKNRRSFKPRHGESNMNPSKLKPKFGQSKPKLAQSFNERRNEYGHNEERKRYFQKSNDSDLKSEYRGRNENIPFASTHYSSSSHQYDKNSTNTQKLKFTIRTNKRPPAYIIPNPGVHFKRFDERVDVNQPLHLKYERVPTQHEHQMGVEYLKQMKKLALMAGKPKSIASPSRKLPSNMMISQSTKNPKELAIRNAEIVAAIDNRRAEITSSRRHRKEGARLEMSEEMIAKRIKYETETKEHLEKVKQHCKNHLQMEFDDWAQVQAAVTHYSYKHSPYTNDKLSRMGEKYLRLALVRELIASSPKLSRTTWFLTANIKFFTAFSYLVDTIDSALQLSTITRYLEPDRPSNPFPVEALPSYRLSVYANSVTAFIGVVYLQKGDAAAKALVKSLFILPSRINNKFVPPVISPVWIKPTSHM